MICDISTLRILDCAFLLPILAIKSPVELVKPFDCQNLKFLQELKVL